MDLEEWRMRGVEAIEVHTLDEDNRTNELAIRRVWVPLHRHCNRMVQRMNQPSDVPVHWMTISFEVSGSS